MASVPDSLVEGFILMTSLVVLTAALEYGSMEEVKKLRSRQDGKSLYNSAILMNLTNNFLIAAPTYSYTSDYVCSPGPHTFGRQCVSVGGIIVVQGLLFYAAHMAFHKVPGLFSLIHGYHHKFNTVVLPSTANAVTTLEFVLAYATPIVTAVAVTGADLASTAMALVLIAVANLLVHTPFLEQRYKLPWFLVSTDDHLSHHRHIQQDYASPLISIDRILLRLFGIKS